MGLYGLVILFVCVPCPPARKKMPFLPLFCSCLFALCLLALPVLVSFHLITDKKETAFIGSFLFGWWLVSPIERKKGRLQAVCRFGLLLLFCLYLSAFLLPWGLQYSINSLCRLHRCGLGIYKPLLCFSWSRGLEFKRFSIIFGFHPIFFLL